MSPHVGKMNFSPHQDFLAMQCFGTYCGRTGSSIANSHLDLALNKLQTYVLYAYISTIINVAMKASMTHKKEKLDRMITEL